MYWSSKVPDKAGWSGSGAILHHLSVGSSEYLSRKFEDLRRSQEDLSRSFEDLRCSQEDLRRDQERLAREHKELLDSYRRNTKKCRPILRDGIVKFLARDFVPDRPVNFEAGHKASDHDHSIFVAKRAVRISICNRGSKTYRALASAEPRDVDTFLSPDIVEKLLQAVDSDTQAVVAHTELSDPALLDLAFEIARCDYSILSTINELGRRTEDMRLVNVILCAMGRERATATIMALEANTDGTLCLPPDAQLRLHRDLHSFVKRE